MIVSAQRFKRAVAAARGNQRARRRVAFRRDSQRTASPFKSCGFSHKRRSEQNENAQINGMTLQEISRLPERIHCHAFVEPRQNLRVNGFEADGDFELSFDLLTETQRARAVCAAQKRRMAFDDDALKVSDKRGNRCVIFRRNRLRVEEAARVVKLDLSRGGKPRQRITNLRSD